MGMKIERNRNEWVTFQDLRTGAIFIDEDDDVNIKCYEEDKDKHYAVVLENGTVWYPFASSEAKEVFPTLTIDKE